MTPVKVFENSLFKGKRFKQESDAMFWWKKVLSIEQHGILEQNNIESIDWDVKIPKQFSSHFLVIKDGQYEKIVVLSTSTGAKDLKDENKCFMAMALGNERPNSFIKR